MLDWWVVGLIGIGGGIVNHILIEGGGVVLPSHGLKGRAHRFDLGVFANMATGAAAATVAYLAAGGSLSAVQHALVAAVGAIGGANFLTSFVQRGESALTGTKAEGYREIADLLKEMVGKNP